MSKAITEKHDERGAGQPWKGSVESAPSIVRDDEPTVARYIGVLGFCLVSVGGFILLVNQLAGFERFSFGWACLFLPTGVIGLLSHAAYDRELQVRRIYWGLGLVLLAVGILLCFIPTDTGMGGLFGMGYSFLFLALLFLLASLHHETDALIRRVTIDIVGGLGAVGAAIFLIPGNNLKDNQFLIPYGALLAILSLGYLCAYVSHRTIASERGYRTGLAIGAVGLVAILLGIARSCFETNYLVPNGLIFIGLGLLYLCVSFALCSDLPIVVLTRREMSSFFFSPIVYLVLVGFSLVAWLAYSHLVGLAIKRELPEPIISFYLFGLWPILTVSFLVPVITMRLLSEEWRTGSLEVLLTAPVTETTVVLGKFISAFLIYLLMWTPWWLFLIALRVMGGTSFEFRSIFSFVVALSVSGMGFVAMGLFYSSLTRNQITSAVLTFAGMMGFLGLYFIAGNLTETNPNSNWLKVIRHMDYIDLWFKSTQGILTLKFLLFHASAAILWLFLTIKVLEARRWA